MDINNGVTDISRIPCECGNVANCGFLKQAMDWTWDAGKAMGKVGQSKLDFYIHLICFGLRTLETPNAFLHLVLVSFTEIHLSWTRRRWKHKRSACHQKCSGHSSGLNVPCEIWTRQMQVCRIVFKPCATCDFVSILEVSLGKISFSA